MVQKYKVTLILTAEGYMELAPLLGSHSPKIEKIIERTGDAKPTLDQSAMSAPRGKRKSKVIETILSTLRGRRSSCPRRAPRRAGARGHGRIVPLSTGLSILQKSGENKRGSDGAYYLSALEAA